MIFYFMPVTRAHMFFQARNVQEFLLVKERSPLCMLPAPLNLVPAALLWLHYLLIYLAQRDVKRRPECDDLGSWPGGSSKAVGGGGTIGGSVDPSSGMSEAEAVALGSPTNSLGDDDVDTDDSHEPMTHYASRHKFHPLEEDADVDHSDRPVGAQIPRPLTRTSRQCSHLSEDGRPKREVVSLSGTASDMIIRCLFVAIGRFGMEYVILNENLLLVTLTYS